MFTRSLSGMMSSSMGGIAFMHKVEQRIFEKQENIPRPFSDVPSSLREKNQASSEFLAQYDIKSFVNYSAYLTAIPWDNRARYVAMASDTFNYMEQIHTVTRKA